MRNEFDGGVFIGEEKILKLDDFFEKSNVFLDSRVFTSDWIPDHFLFREEEVKKIGQMFADLVKGRPGHVWCNGLPSTGKSHIIKKAVQEFNDYCEAKKQNTKYVYATAREQTMPRFLAAVLLALNPLAKVVDWNSGRAKDAIIKEANKYDGVCFVFDEIDKILLSRFENPVNTLIGMFTRIKEAHPNFKSEYMLVVVSNNANLYRGLEKSTASTFVANNIHFPAYDAIQLKEILLDRCKKGLHDGVIDEGDVGYLASQIFSSSKDVRTALKILLEAGRMAEHNGRAKITKENLTQASETVEKNKLLEIISKLDDSQLALLVGIAKSQKANPDKLITSNIVYRNYATVANNFGLIVLKSRYLFESVSGKLDSIGMITTALTSKGYKTGVTRQFQILGEDVEEILQLSEGELKKRMI